MRWKAKAALALALAGTGAIAGQVAAASQRWACASWATRVDGVVVDREGHGIAGALVVARPVRWPAPALGGGVVTDRDGRFRMVGLPPGDYAFVSLVRGAIATTPEMPVVDRLIVSISLGGEATRI
jgi:hypothetical protein